MVNQVNLTAAMNTNLLALQNTQRLMDMTQQRLATGLKVNSALDNPSSFFTAQGLNQRAGDLDGLLDSMGQGIQTLKAADEGIRAITKLVEQARAIVNQASETSDTDRIERLESQFNEILSQITQLANDSNYKGINLINNDTGADPALTVFFNEKLRSSADITKIEIGGVDSTAAGLGLAEITGANSWVDGGAPDAAAIDASMDEVLTAIETLRGFASDFANAYSIVQNRQSFTENLINVLTEGANKLTLADMNEESANMLALQTRQQMGINSLSLASQANQAVLRLF
jgi:flagellin-like hook-associated protein FlgL